VERPGRRKIKSKTPKDLVRKSQMESSMDESNKLLDELWAKTVDTFGWNNRVRQLCACFGCQTV
jgi:hypothetical protein